MALADKSGLSQADLLEVLGLGAMACPMIALKVGGSSCGSSSGRSSSTESSWAVESKAAAGSMLQYNCQPCSAGNLTGLPVSVHCPLTCAAPPLAQGPGLQQRSYPPAFKLVSQQKDMRLALALG